MEQLLQLHLSNVYGQRTPLDQSFLLVPCSRELLADRGRYQSTRQRRYRQQAPKERSFQSRALLCNIVTIDSCIRIVAWRCRIVEEDKGVNKLNPLSRKS